MLKGHDIICISSIDWDFLWQAHQEIMSTFARNGSNVLFIDNTGVRSPRLSDIPRLMHRIRNWRRSIRGFRQEADNLYVYSPVLLPFPYSRIAQWVNRHILVSSIRRWMRSVDFHAPIIWTFLPTKVTLDLAQAIDHSLLVYYCMDKFSATSKGAGKVVETEREIIRSADLVFAMSHRLVDFCRQFRSDVVRIPMGVNAKAFDESREAAVERPEDLADVTPPIIGYVGGVRKSVDKNLIQRIAVEMPECSLVFVGPLQMDVSDLATYPNIRFLGRKDHAEIPRYIRSFDCCILPYVIDAYTNSVSPAKLHEYLIMGKPVVSTNITEVDMYATRTPGDSSEETIYVAGSPEEFIGHLRRALKEEGRQIETRIALAREHSWPAKIEMMSSLINERLETKVHDSSTGWQDRLRVYYRQAQQRLSMLVAAGAVFALFYVAIFHTPVMWVIADPLKIAHHPVAADAIVVFAGGVGESGQAGRGYEERVVHAAHLYQAGYARHLVFSSGFMYTLKEPLLMHALAVSLGIPDDAITLETQAHSTYANVNNVNKILAERGWRQVLLVSSPYHMRRALWTWRKLAPEIKVIPTPVPNSRFYAHRWGANLEQIRAILYEYAALVTYWWRGWL